MEELLISGNLTAGVIDFSLLSLFLRADLVVKSVIIILIISSVYSWTVIISKIVRMRQLKQLDSEFDEIFWSGNSFEDLYDTFNYNQEDLKSKIFCSAIAEWKKSNKDVGRMQASGLNSLKESEVKNIQNLIEKLKCRSR